MKGKLLHWEFWDCERGGAGVGGAGKLDMGRFEGESDAKDTDLIICRGLSVLHFPSIFVAVTQVLTLYCACTGLASASCRVLGLGTAPTSTFSVFLPWNLQLHILKCDQLFVLQLFVYFLRSF